MFVCCCRCLAALFFIMLLQFVEICRSSFIHSSLKVLPQHSNQIEIWTWFFFFFSSHSVVDLLCWGAWNQCPAAWPKASPNHQPTTTTVGMRRLCWYFVSGFLQTWCCISCVLYYLHFALLCPKDEVLWLVQKQLCIWLAAAGCYSPAKRKQWGWDVLERQKKRNSFCILP